VTRLVLAPAAARDIDRLADFLLEFDPIAAIQTGRILIDGLQVLKRHPLMGRSVEQGYREIVISRGNTGYVALYSFDVANDVAVVLGIRHQREAGYF
jgi:plasmid stabilization system protein ParE